MPVSPLPPAEIPASPRSAWEPPRLTRHESLTVLTQSFLGGGVGAFFLLDIGCSVRSGGNCFGRSNP